MAKNTNTLLAVIALLLIPALAFSLTIERPSITPEIDDIHSILKLKIPPHGVLFTIMESDEEALEWITPRLLYYTDLLRNDHPDMPIAIVSHGDEILMLTSEKRPDYASMHDDVERLVTEFGVEFNICGSFAAFNGLDESDFPAYIQVVPFGPASITDYKSVGYKQVSIELVW